MPEWSCPAFRHACSCGAEMPASTAEEPAGGAAPAEDQAVAPDERDGPIGGVEERPTKAVQQQGTGQLLSVAVGTTDTDRPAAAAARSSTGTCLPDGAADTADTDMPAAAAAVSSTGNCPPDEAADTADTGMPAAAAAVSSAGNGPPDGAADTADTDMPAAATVSSTENGPPDGAADAADTDMAAAGSAAVGSAGNSPPDSAQGGVESDVHMADMQPAHRELPASNEDATNMVPASADDPPSYAGNQDQDSKPAAVHSPVLPGTINKAPAAPQQASLPEAAKENLAANAGPVAAGQQPQKATAGKAGKRAPTAYFVFANAHRNAAKQELLNAGQAPKVSVAQVRPGFATHHGGTGNALKYPCIRQCCFQPLHESNMHHDSEASPQLCRSMDM